MSEAKQPAQIQLASGRSIPQLGLGTWRSDKGQVENAVRHAIEHGVRLIDCAYVYANQTEVGAGITKALHNLGGKVKREDLYVVSKLWNSQHHPDDIEAAVRKCLEELQLTYLDLYLVHWPTAFARGDNLFPKNEQGQFVSADISLLDTWKALERLVDLGLVKDIGVSNYSTAEVDEVLAGARIKPVVNQVELHPYWPQTQLAADMKARGLVVMAYSPLGNLGGADTPSVLDDPVVKAIATELNTSPAQVLIRWSLQKGHVCIPKSVSAARIEQNFNVLNFEIPAAAIEKLDSLSAKNLRFVNPPFRAGGKPVF